MRHNVIAAKQRALRVRRYRMKCLEAVKSSSLMTPGMPLDDNWVYDIATWIEGHLLSWLPDEEIRYARGLGLAYHRRDRKRMLNENPQNK